MNTQKSQFDSYGIKIAILYSIVWFIDLLDASMLNVALPNIAQAFNIDPTNAEWTIIGFLLALTIAIPISSWLGNVYGLRRTFLFSQVLYSIASLACGFAFSLSQLITFRIIQGAAGGLLIPIGMTLLIQSIPKYKWSAITSRMNLVTLIAPAVGPLLAGYITNMWGWRWLFFSKIPLSLVCLLLSYLWVKEYLANKKTGRFDWLGFILLTGSLSTLFIALSEIGKSHVSIYTLGLLIIISLLTGIFFIYNELRCKNPMLSLSIFKFKLFSIGNIVQCAANIIFLGATFITGLYLQDALHMDIVMVGWILSAITPGMICILPIVSRYYNRLGPLPFIIPGLLGMAISMFGLTFVTAQTSSLLIAFLIFLEGASSAIVQTPNVIAIFSEIPSDLKSDGSAIYALGKQLSATVGVALSTMIVSIGMQYYGIQNLQDTVGVNLAHIFHYAFYVLGLIPLITIPLCYWYDNKKALSFVRKKDHLESETELETE